MLNHAKILKTEYFIGFIEVDGVKNALLGLQSSMNKFFSSDLFVGGVVSLS